MDVVTLGQKHITEVGPRIALRAAQGEVSKFKIIMHHDDLTITRKISSGDEAAMKQVYEAHSGPLFHFVKSWLSDAHMASDIVHETMLEVWKKADRFKGRSSLKSWIFSIARNKSIDTNRKMSRLVYTDEFSDEADIEANPSEALSNAQDSKTIKAAVSKLSDTHKRMIHLAFYEDLSYKEISEIEDCPVGTVKTRILHAKKLLMRDLSGFKA